MLRSDLFSGSGRRDKSRPQEPRIAPDVARGSGAVDDALCGHRDEHRGLVDADPCEPPGAPAIAAALWRMLGPVMRLGSAILDQRTRTAACAQAIGCEWRAGMSRVKCSAPVTASPTS